MEQVSFEKASELIGKLKARVGEAVFGQQDLIEEVLCALLSGGHILVTGAPGLAKTTLVRAISRNLGLSFGRVQFTPDLLPSDILGSEILNMDPESGRRSFEFTPGPIFANLLLADEINRASPRTQSALLEAMQERSVSIARKAHPLPLPFMVFATQNPLESEGTFPLPEAQLDRFLIHALVDYPDEESELKMLHEHSRGKLFGEQQGSATRDVREGSVSHGEVQALIEAAAAIPIDDTLLQMIRDVVRMTRPSDPTCPADLRDAIDFGAGPRAGLALLSVCRSAALLSGANTVRWSHVRRMIKPVLRHRMALSMGAQGDGLTEDLLIDKLMSHMEHKHAHLTRS